MSNEYRCPTCVQNGTPSKSRWISGPRHVDGEQYYDWDGQQHFHGFAFEKVFECSNGHRWRGVLEHGCDACGAVPVYHAVAE